MSWGAMRYLYTLRGGEMIYTKDASGHSQQWQLTQMRVLEHTDFPQDYWSKTGSRQLVVTTCGGTIRGGHYDKDIFAIATPVTRSRRPDPPKTEITPGVRPGSSVRKGSASRPD